MDAVDGADLDAGVVLGPDAGFSDHISHRRRMIRDPTPRVDACDPAHGSDRTARLRGAAAARRARRAGALPRARRAAARARADARPARHGRPRGPGRVPQRAARRAHRGPPRRLRARPARATIEELDGLATWRLLRAAERAGAEHLLWTAPLGATPHHPSRVHAPRRWPRRRSPTPQIATTTLATSLVYAPGDRRLRGSSGSAAARRAADRPRRRPHAAAVGRRRRRRRPRGARRGPDGHARHELAGPEVLTHRQVVELVLRRPAAAGARSRSRSPRCARA